MVPDHETLGRRDPAVTAWSAPPADELVNDLFRAHAVTLVRVATLLIRSFPGTQGTEAAAVADPTGRYLLVEYNPHPGGTRLARLNLKTGRLSQLSAVWAVEAAIAW
jgi:hypothetical protein